VVAKNLLRREVRLGVEDHARARVDDASRDAETSETRDVARMDAEFLAELVRRRAKHVLGNVHRAPSIETDGSRFGVSAREHQHPRGLADVVASPQREELAVPGANADAVSERIGETFVSTRIVPHDDARETMSSDEGSVASVNQSSARLVPRNVL